MRWARLAVLAAVLPFCVVADVLVTFPLVLGFGAVELARWAGGCPVLDSDALYLARSSLLAWWIAGVRRAWGSR